MTPVDIGWVAILTPLALVAVILEWEHNVRRDRICAGCPSCQQKLLEAQGRCTSCRAYLLKGKCPNGHQ